MFVVTLENKDSYYSLGRAEELKRLLNERDLLAEVIYTDRDEIMKEMGLRENGSLIAALKRYPQDQGKELLSMLFKSAITGVFAAKERELRGDIHIAIVDSSFLVTLFFALFPKHSGINTKVLEQRNFLALAQKANAMVDLHLFIANGKKSPRPGWEVTKLAEASTVVPSLDEAADLIVEKSAAKAYREIVNIANILGRKQLIK